MIAASSSILNMRRTTLSTPFSALPTPLRWRSETRQRILASQIGSLLLQRSDPISVLKSNPNLLPSPLPSSLFLCILARIRCQPETALHFFRFARSDLQFRPDIHSISKLTLYLIESKARHESKKILEPVLRSEPVQLVLHSMVRAASACKHSRSKVLSFVLENYSFLRLIPNSLETLKRIRVLGCVPSTVSCNGLLDALCSSNELKLALVCYAVLVRARFEHDEQTWTVLCRILCGQGNLKGADKLLNLGVCGVSCYDLVIGCYCKNGDFRSAVWVLNHMNEKNLMPTFATYASFLDGGYKFGDVGVIRLISKEMIVRGLLPTVPCLDYDWIISSLCELEKPFAGEMFFRKARRVKFKFGKGVYASLLRVFAKEGRGRQAMEVYKVMLQEGVTMSRSSCKVFLSGMCKGEPSDEVDEVLKDLIGKGFEISADDLSIYIDAQCNKGKWAEASDMVNFVLVKGILLDSFCCASLVKHFCKSGLIDSAMLLHDKVKKSGGCLDVISYNVLLEALFSRRRIEEARLVFEFMQVKTIANSSSFVIAIKSLCHEKELRRAMNAHDEMLRLGLKPDDATYRLLISGFV